MINEEILTFRQDEVAKMVIIKIKFKLHKGFFWKNEVVNFLSNIRQYFKILRNRHESTRDKKEKHICNNLKA